MTHQRDIERVLDLWLEEGSKVAPDRVIDVVADRIERQRQRGGRRLFNREPTMNTQLRLAAAVAVIAILGAGAIYLTRPSSTPGDGGKSPVPSASPAVSVAPSPTPLRISSRTFQPALSIQLPVSWIVGDDARAFRLSTTTTASGPAGAIEFKPSPVLGINANGCEGLAVPGAGTSVDALVAGLSSAPEFTVVDSGTVALDGRTAQVLDIRLSPSWTETCNWSGGQPAALVFTVADPPGPFWGLIGSERTRLILLDVDGVVLAISVSPTDGAEFDAFLAGAMTVVESVTFTP